MPDKGVPAGQNVTGHTRKREVANKRNETRHMGQGTPYAPPKPKAPKKVPGAR